MITVQLSREEIIVCCRNTRLACIGGRSNIRQRNDRQNRLTEDNLIGQLCNAAGSKFSFGNIDSYIELRNQANANPLQGDNGIDLPGQSVDFKGSLMRASLNPLHYRLPVRPREIHDNWNYVLILVPPGYEIPKSVYIVGWATTDDLLAKGLEESGPFNGAYTIHASSLRKPEEFKEKLIGGYFKV